MNKWQKYEQEKRAIKKDSPEEYDEKIKEIIDRIKI